LRRKIAVEFFFVGVLRSRRLLNYQCGKLGRLRTSSSAKWAKRLFSGNNYKFEKFIV